MIKSFADSEAEKFWQTGKSRKFGANIQKRAYAKLQLLDAAKTLRFLESPPGNMLEKLSGNRKGQHSIRINQQWRICFVWDNGNAYKVEITDYH